MANRVIKTRAKGSSVQLAACLESLFALELLAPGPDLYLISPWISDVPLLSNRHGQWRAILSDDGVDMIRLSDALRMLGEKGTRVRILCRPGQPYTDDFLRKLSPDIVYRFGDLLHEKGLIGRHFYLRGSMNFTHSGIHINDESVELTTDSAEVALALIEAQARWEDVAT